MRRGTYGAALVIARKRMGLSQDALAERAGMDRGQLSRIERGVTKWPEQATRDRLAAAIGVTDEEVLAELNLQPEFRPEYQFGMDPDEHDIREAMRELPHEDRVLIARFVDLLVERNKERYE